MEDISRSSGSSLPSSRSAGYVMFTLPKENRSQCAAEKIFSIPIVEKEVSWYGIEQEYTLCRRMLTGLLNGWQNHGCATVFRRDRFSHVKKSRFGDYRLSLSQHASSSEFNLVNSSLNKSALRGSVSSAELSVYHSMRSRMGESSDPVFVNIRQGSTSKPTCTGCQTRSGLLMRHAVLTGSQSEEGSLYERWNQLGCSVADRICGPNHSEESCFISTS
ncbi:hypothetical protein C5167_041523 [Papaver somniferum]|nr:hypothetical protein C5167_041523 [Papaver somniferum]